ncbi:MAG: TolC family outer membrane protein [Alphaproteobacteria bacterium]|nr:TolC family outer membrane protein [Alphaproteobacteria bacterium]MBQ8630905.1 TolC family outer membrane protein [Alphaproteobacteria bacterium]
MKKTFLCSLLMAAAIPGVACAQDIFEALSDAYRSNPTLQAQRAYLRSVDENVAIAKSGYRPNIYLQGSYADADVDSNQPGDASRTKQKVIAAKVSQPLFSGLQTVNSVKSADKIVRSQQDNLFNVEQTVFLDASTAYLDVLRDTAIVDLQKNNEKLLKKRLDETIQRFKVGEVTRTDVSQARARHSQAKADRISSEGTLQASRANYARIIGVRPEDLKAPESLDKFLPASFEEALEYAKVHNYSILQAKNYLEAKEYDVKTQTGALLPSITLDGEASKTKGDIDILPNDSEVDNLEWSVNMTVPLYSSGETRAKIRQSKYQKWQAREQVAEAERSVTESVTSAWEYMLANKAMLSSIKDQIKANEIALDGVQKEEALGNRTILDVLDAYQELLNSNVEQVKARRNYYVSAMSLLQAMGKLTARNLNLDVEYYDAKKFYKETRDKWLSISVDD